jgi:predicted nucleic acid-binding protein
VRIYLDANIVIYLIEQPAVWGPKTAARAAALSAAGDQVVLSDLHRLECRVGPLTRGDAALLGQFDLFFASPAVLLVGLTADVCNRAAAIRAAHRFKPLDSFHLAAAVIHGCDRFLTNDARLSTFPDIPVEILS